MDKDTLKETEFKIHLNTKLCDVADLLMHYYKPCGIDKDGNCKGGKVENCCHHTFYEKPEGGCIFNCNGCTVRNLGCKVWFCNEAFDSLPKKLKLTLKALEIIDRIYALSSYPEEHYNEKKDQYQITDTLRYFDDWDS